MADFFATYSASSNSSSTVTALQGTTPWIVAGAGTAGTAGTAVLTVQGIAGGTAIPVSGSITANNSSVSATGAAVPASGTYIAASVAGTLTGLVATANGLKVDGSAATQPVSGTVAVTQSTSPWVTSGTSTVSGTVAVTQSTSPWVTSGTSTVSGTVAATQSGTWTVQPGNTANTTAWKVDGSAVTQPVSGAVSISGSVTVGNIAAVTTSTAIFQAEGAVAFGSITNSYVTLFTPTAATKILQMRNNTNAAIAVSMDAGSTTNYVLDAGDAVSFDLLANALNMGATAIQVKYAVGAPTSGSFRINGAH